MTTTVNGVDVTDMTLRASLVGAWEATLTADTTDAAKINGAATIELDGVRFIGTAAANADAGGKVTARVVPGADGLGTVLRPQSYTGTTVRVIVADILRDCGESLSGKADEATLGRTLRGWVRLEQTGRDALKRLTEAIGVSWRMTPEGRLWLGPETWPTVEPSFVVIAEMPTESATEVAIEGFGVMPGQTFRSERISAVEYRLGGSSLRLTAKTGQAQDEAAQRLQNLVKRQTQTDYFALYPARVVAQNADGTLELKLDSPKMPGMSKIPIRHGLPGVTALEVQTGARVLVGFEGADPTRAFAALWGGTDSLTRLRLSGILEVDGDSAVALASPLETWAQSVESRLSTLGAPGAGPVGVASEALFTS